VGARNGASCDSLHIIGGPPCDSTRGLPNDEGSTATLFQVAVTLSTSNLAPGGRRCSGGTTVARHSETPVQIRTRSGFEKLSTLLPSKITSYCNPKIPSETYMGPKMHGRPAGIPNRRVRFRKSVQMQTRSSPRVSQKNWRHYTQKRSLII